MTEERSGAALPGRIIALFVMTVVAVVVVMPRAAEAAPPPSDPCLSTPVEGQKLRRAGKLLEARARFSFCARDVCPAEVVQACSRWSHEVDASIPTVVVTVRDDKGRDLPGARVSIDGGELESVGVRAIELDPGEHRFVFEKKGSPPIEQKVVIREGEKNRSIAATFAGPPEKKPPPTTTTPIDTDTAHNPGSATSSSWWTPMHTTGTVLVGVGGASALTGFVLALVAKLNHNTARSKCNAPVDDCPPDAVRSGDSARSLANGATIVIVAGAGVAAVGGALILFTSAPTERDGHGGDDFHAKKKAALGSRQPLREVSIALGMQSLGVIGRW